MMSGGEELPAFYGVGSAVNLGTGDGTMEPLEPLEPLGGGAFFLGSAPCR